MILLSYICMRTYVDQPCYHSINERNLQGIYFIGQVKRNEKAAAERPRLMLYPTEEGSALARLDFR